MQVIQRFALVNARATPEHVAAGSSIGHMSMVTCQWSHVNGHMSMVTCHHARSKHRQQPPAVPRTCNLQPQPCLPHTSHCHCTQQAPAPVTSWFKARVPCAKRAQGGVPLAATRDQRGFGPACVAGDVRSAMGGTRAPFLTRHTSRHTSHVTRHTSRHTSHVTRHTSHVTRHTSHVTRHLLCCGFLH